MKHYIKKQLWAFNEAYLVHLQGLLDFSCAVAKQNANNYRTLRHEKPAHVMQLSFFFLIYINS